MRPRSKPKSRSSVVVRELAESFNLALVGGSDDTFLKILPLPGEARGLYNWKRFQRIYRAHQIMGRSLQMAVQSKQPETKHQKKNDRDFLLRDVHSIERRIKFLQTVFVPLSILYYTLIVPYRFAFQIYSSTWETIDLIFDFIYISMGLFYFHFRYTEKHKRATYAVVRRHSTIFAHGFLYRTLFIIIISAPWELWKGQLLMFKILQLYNASGLVSELDASNRAIVTGKFDLQLRILLPLRNELVTLIVVIHISACFWIFIGTETTDSWLHVWNINHVYSTVDIFIQAFMFMTETISTVGYGDTPAQSYVEYWVPIFLQFVSSYFYTLFIVLIQEAVQKHGLVNHLIQIKKDAMISWLLTLKIANDSNLYSTKFSNHLEEFIIQEKGVNIKENIKCDPHFNVLPFELKWKLLNTLLTREFQVFEDFLNPLSRDFIMGLIVEMIHFQLEVSEELFSDGYCDGIYMLSDGLIDQMTQVGQRTRKLHMRGSVIGLDYLVLKKKPKDIYRTIGKAKGYYVPRAAFLSLLRVFLKDFRYFKYEVLKEKVVNFCNVSENLLNPSFLNDLDSKQKNLAIIPIEPPKSLGFIPLEPKIGENKRFSVAKLRRFGEKASSNLDVEDLANKMNSDNMQSPFFSPALRFKVNQKSEEQLNGGGSSLQRENSESSREALLENKRDSFYSLVSVPREDLEKIVATEGKGEPSKSRSKLAHEFLPGLVHNVTDHDESTMYLIDGPESKKSKSLKSIAAEAKSRKSIKSSVRKEGMTRPSEALSGVFSENNPLRNLIPSDDVPEKHDHKKVIVFTDLDDSDNEAESDEESEDGLDNSFDIPIEDVFDQQNALNTELFTLGEICSNLDGRYRTLLKQYQSLANRLKISASLAGKAASGLRYKIR